MIKFQSPMNPKIYKPKIYNPKVYIYIKYSPVVSEYLPPQENAPSVLTPDTDTESINDELKENYNNEQIEDILCEIVQNQELSNAIEPEIRAYEEQSDLIGNGSQINEEEPRILSHINTKEKKEKTEES
ncbi:unnamed protein product [Parnassius mnemosyne]|uniref:Uncharacterized protein n=1 Tax=Parnassius mnemosyne TaxID=213953 RepID=A0AAV1KRQ0_9NEOP